LVSSPSQESTTDLSTSFNSESSVTVAANQQEQQSDDGQTSKNINFTMHFSADFIVEGSIAVAVTTATSTTTTVTASTSTTSASISAVTSKTWPKSMYTLFCILWIIFYRDET